VERFDDLPVGEEAPMARRVADSAKLGPDAGEPRATGLVWQMCGELKVAP